MNEIEAIKIFQTTSVGNLSKHFENIIGTDRLYEYDKEDRQFRYQQARSIAIRALQEKASREKGCEYR